MGEKYWGRKIYFIVLVIIILSESFLIACSLKMNLLHQNEIIISRPVGGYVYIMDKEILPSLSGKTIIVGKITIFADAEKEEEIEHVEFIIDDTLLHKCYLPPFFFTWNTLKYARGKHTIKVVARDIEENIFFDELDVSVISFQRRGGN